MFLHEGNHEHREGNDDGDDDDDADASIWDEIQTAFSTYWWVLKLLKQTAWDKMSMKELESINDYLLHIVNKYGSLTNKKNFIFSLFDFYLVGFMICLFYQVDQVQLVCLSNSD